MRFFVFYFIGPYCTHYSNPKSIRPLTSGASTLSLHFKGDKYSGASFGFEIIVTAIRIGKLILSVINLNKTGGFSFGQ